MDVEQYPLIKEIPKELWSVLEMRDGAPRLLVKLKEMYTPEAVAYLGPEQRAWECCALFYRDHSLPHQAIQVISALYEQMILHQVEAGKQTHKAMPLVWLADWHGIWLGHPATAKRYLMLTLSEDAIRDCGSVNVEAGGIYWRLAFQSGMSDSDIKRYASRIYEIYQQHPKESRYPEWLLQELDNDWITEYPTSSEAFLYLPNRHYVRYLLDSIGETTGKILERLADYVLSIIPGIRTHRRCCTPSTDYDILCGVEGPRLDFRAELGRYFICECKDWSRPVDFTAIAKFCSVLDSAKCKSGIIFSREGLSGADETTNAARQQLKFFQNRGIVILVIDRSDLDAIAAGENVTAMLRRKYEQVRLDLSQPR